MISVSDLRTMYREEKAALADDMSDESFPSFKEWYEQYMYEYSFSHADSSFCPLNVGLEMADAQLESVRMF